MRPTVQLVSHQREYYAWECDWHSYLLADFDLVHHFDPERKFVGENSILVVSCSGPEQEVEQTRAHFKKYQAAGLPVGLIHLSDEWQQAPIDFYAEAAFIFRNYYRAAAAPRDGRGHFFGLGWKTGFREMLIDRPIGQRSLTWSFVGMMKSTRAAMLQSAARVPGGKHLVTTGFGGQNGGVPIREFSQILNDTVFALCPRGNTAVDCFRVYEALEAGAIPIVEDDGGLDLAGELLWPWNFKRVEPWRRSYWRYHFKNPGRPSFWKMAYGVDFPCPRIMHWETLDVLLGRLDIEAVSARCRAWWAKYKQDLRMLMSRTVREKFFAGREAD
ncbi:MAG: hypothetical protein WCI73_09135 [Phycisphaerae bacterium]